MKKIILFLVAIGLLACREQRPSQPDAEQSAQLNDAEDMLNAEAERNAH